MFGRLGLFIILNSIYNLHVEQTLELFRHV